jgi:hypothetical protein
MYLAINIKTNLLHISIKLWVDNNYSYIHYMNYKYYNYLFYSNLSAIIYLYIAYAIIIYHTYRNMYHNNASIRLIKMIDYFC